MDVGALAAVVGCSGAPRALEAGLAGFAHRRHRAVNVAALGPSGLSTVPALGGEASAVETLAGLESDAHHGVAATSATTTHDGRASCLSWGRLGDRFMVAGVVGRFHNGDALRTACLERGTLFAGQGEAELLLQLLALSRQRTLVNRVVEVLERLVGAYSLVVVSDELSIAARDPMGFRPLWLGRIAEGFAVASEPAALAAMGASEPRELAAGELVVLEPGSSPSSLRPWGVSRRAACVLEWLRLARLDTSFEGLSVHTLRKRLGRATAAAHPVPPGVVTALPGECPAAAVAFANQAGMPLEVVFVPPPVDLGILYAKQGPAVVEAAVRGREVTLVHGPTVAPERLRAVVGKLSRAGARRVHSRCYAPLLRSRCPHGVRLHAPLGVPAGGEDTAALRVVSGADSAAALSPEELASALGREPKGYCSFCLGGEAPLAGRDAGATPQLPLFQGADAER